MELIIFLILSAIILVTSCMIAFSRNLVYSAFALLGTFFGMAGLFVMLSADFVAVIQVLVYVGGILVLYLFAVLMTLKISDAKISNASISIRLAIPALILLLILLGRMIFTTQWLVAPDLQMAPTTALIGSALLTEYLLPFELISVLLLGALVGAVASARREVK